MVNQNKFDHSKWLFITEVYSKVYIQALAHGRVTSKSWHCCITLTTDQVLD